MITSLQNDRVKRVVRLRDSRARRELGVFAIDGARELLRAIEAGFEFEELFVCPERIAEVNARAGEEASAVDQLNADQLKSIERAGRQSQETIEVTPAVMDKISYGQRRGSFVAVARSRRLTMEELNPPRHALLAIVDGLDKPGNLGAIIRTADGAGLNGVLVAAQDADLFNPNTIRASLGTVFTMPIACAPTQQIIAWLDEQVFQVVTTIVDAKVPYQEIDYGPPTAIVLGSEADGLSSAWREESIARAKPVRIPMLGHADSLNVSAAAAILFYEAVRQRGFNKPN